MKKLLEYVNEWNPNNNGFNYEEYLNEANNFNGWVDDGEDVCILNEE